MPPLPSGLLLFCPGYSAHYLGESECAVMRKPRDREGSRQRQIPAGPPWVILLGKVCLAAVCEHCPYWLLGSLPYHSASTPLYWYPGTLPFCNQLAKEKQLIPAKDCSECPTTLSCPQEALAGTWHRLGLSTKEKKEACFPFTQKYSVARKENSIFWVLAGPLNTIQADVGKNLTQCSLPAVTTQTAQGRARP